MSLNYSRIAQSGGYLTKREIVIAALAMLVVFEAPRRVLSEPCGAGTYLSGI